MQQKLSIIIALLGHPQILFLDEPTLGLDILSQKTVMRTLVDQAKQQGTTIIVNSHQLDVIDSISDRILVLEQGKSRL